MRIEPAGRLAGHVTVPGDKSISHRAVLIASICEGETLIRGFGRSEDTERTVRAVRSLAVRVEELEVNELVVHGVGFRGLEAPDGPIDCGNAGTLVRLLAGILAGQEGQQFELVGDESLSTRPMNRIAEPLTRMGTGVETDRGRLPLGIEGRPLRGITYELPVASAQVKSCILLAGLYAQGETIVIEPVPTRDHTESLLEMAGARVDPRPNRVTVWPAEHLALGGLEVPGDFSSAAPFIVAATLLKGSELHVNAVNLNPRRTGLLRILERMGARVAIRKPRRICGEPAGDLVVRHSELTATDVTGDEVPAAIDELPLFALAAACASGESVLRGAAELRAKESDRIEALVEGLSALGADIQATPDGFRVRGVSGRLQGGAMASRVDHRIAMVAGAAGLMSTEGVEIGDPGAVAVSFPGFFDLLETLIHAP
ncbi:MAG: 3-phosphoshikimate 1-carboxyvinyltransferase [Thermoleophilaceae bacterium]|nr:3-phosphoshikimate 1-carboxyvinyltransferase [Thermoleophilaceae bacterium]